MHHIAAAFKVWFGIDEEDVKCFVAKMKVAAVNTDFSKEVFDLVMAAVTTHGSYTEGKKAKVQAA